MSLLAVDIDLLGQAKGTHTVNETKIDGLGAAPLIHRDGVKLDAEYLGRRCLVHIQPIFKGMQQAFVLGQVSHNA